MSTNVVTRKIVWPTKPCTRCGGGGEYSYNPIHGTMCFGCNGKGRQLANGKVEAIVAEYRALVKSKRNCCADKLTAGITVYVNDGRLAGHKDGKGRWAEIASIDFAGATSTAVVVMFVDGTTATVHPRGIVRTYNDGVDAQPFMARCADALGKTSKAAARAEYEGQLAEAGWTL